MNPTAEIEAFFHNIEGDCRSPSLRASTCTIKFNVSGLGMWFVTIKNGTCEVVHETPDAILTLSPETFERIIDGNDPLTPATAMQQGLLEVEGDPNLPCAVLVEYLDR